jgi:hypothetical protein
LKGTLAGIAAAAACLVISIFFKVTRRRPYSPPPGERRSLSSWLQQSIFFVVGWGKKNCQTFPSSVLSISLSLSRLNLNLSFQFIHPLLPLNNLLAMHQLPPPPPVVASASADFKDRAANQTEGNRIPLSLSTTASSFCTY